MRLMFVILGLVGLMLVPVLVFDNEIDSAFAGEEGIRLLQSHGDWALIVSDLVPPVPSTAVISALGDDLWALAGRFDRGHWFDGRGSHRLWRLPAAGKPGTPLFGRRHEPCEAGPILRPIRPRRHRAFALDANPARGVVCLAGGARMRFVPFLAALACGSFAMGFAFAFLGDAYLDRPALGLAISALIPIAIWPILHIMLRSPKTDSSR